MTWLCVLLQNPFYPLDQIEWTSFNHIRYLSVHFFGLWQFLILFFLYIEKQIKFALKKTKKKTIITVCYKQKHYSTLQVIIIINFLIDFICVAATNLHPNV